MGTGETPTQEWVKGKAQSGSAVTDMHMAMECGAGVVRVIPPTNLFAVRADAKLALPDRLHMPLPGSMLNYFLAKKKRGRNKGAQVGRI